MSEEAETWLKLVDEPHFDILVLGTGGGPSEDDLSCYFCKPKQQAWSEGFTIIEGGSGAGALTKLLKTRPRSFKDFREDGQLPGLEDIWRYVNSYLISHAHFDHIAGLVLLAGSCSSSKAIYGTERTLKNLQHVFDGGVWPALASFSSEMPYCYHTVSTSPQTTFSSSKGLRSFAMPISHGKATTGRPYESTAFFIANEKLGQYVLFFGDVDADSVSGDIRNELVWQKAAPLIKAGELSSIFLECSYPSDRPEHQLYGHLSPPYLFQELDSLARCLQPANPDDRPAKRPLEGINILIIHIKSSCQYNAFQVISQEIAALEQERQTGAHFVLLQQGMRLEL